MTAAKLKKLSRLGLVVGVLAFGLALAIGLWTSATFLSMIGTVLLIASIPLLLCSGAVFVLTFGDGGLSDDD